MRAPYRVFDHTADVGVVVRGRDVAELFANAGVALYDQIADPETVAERADIAIHAEGATLEDLLLNWLRELLDCFYGKGLLLKRFKVLEATDTSVKAVAFGETMDPSRHAMRKEIKGVTYHLLKVERAPKGWRARVVFDI